MSAVNSKTTSRPVILKIPLVAVATLHKTSRCPNSPISLFNFNSFEMFEEVTISTLEKSTNTSQSAPSRKTLTTVSSSVGVREGNHPEEITLRYLMGQARLSVNLRCRRGRTNMKKIVCKKLAESIHSIATEFFLFSNIFVDKHIFCVKISPKELAWCI